MKHKSKGDKVSTLIEDALIEYIEKYGLSEKAKIALSFPDQRQHDQSKST
ncbi:hypothetical protein GGR95_003470 [Sulfitobacter undariae]|uniref:Uncharacterized protein n=1 Tax=Sulfitobacter undariae TaxID=1563671 RepID=A0A7W6H1D0_9RHOB|nr:hypothetical protein [Sulfitobacter undariae]MBB3995806.1 hypothetical protein [Sulfitobacter undariae]